MEFLEGDLAEPDVARHAVHGVDYVLHQAAIPSVPRSVTDPITSNRANITASLMLAIVWRYIRKFNRSARRLLEAEIDELDKKAEAES